MSMHEDFNRGNEVKLASERSFGVVFTVVFAVVAVYPLLGGGSVRWWAVAVSAALLLVALAKPDLLRPANRLWMRFGMLLHRIVSPLVLGALLYLVITPTGVLMRLMGKDPLRRRFDAKLSSYWIERSPPGPVPQSMPQQF